MEENPFTSDTFSSIWLKHFNGGNPPVAFPAVSGLNFVPHPRLKCYVNVGRTHTKGIHYGLDNAEKGDLDGKTLLIYDVPGYFNQSQPAQPFSDRIGALKVRQYPGFLIDLSRFGNLEGYMTENFGRKSRNKLRRDRRRLEGSFDMEYRFYFGEISGEEHEQLFHVFRQLMEKRYGEKGEVNNNLEPTEWNFYKEVSLQMIREQRAALLVIYAQGRPVGFMLNYLSEDILFQAITVFDTDYSHFNIGTTGFLELIDWCYGHGIKILDFSKGYYPYKAAWGNRSYVFEYHVLYDRKSAVARIKAYLLAAFFRLKQGLRALKLNSLIHRMAFRFGSGHSGKEGSSHSYSFEELVGEPPAMEPEPLNPDKAENAYLKRGLVDFLYFNHEHYRDARIFRLRNIENRFLLQGKNLAKIMVVNSP